LLDWQVNKFRALTGAFVRTQTDGVVRKLPIAERGASSLHASAR
jgi:hypothetical protein